MKLIDFSELLLSQSDYARLREMLAALHSGNAAEYDLLSGVLPKIATIYSKDDYIDFIRQGFSVPDDLFILGYLSVCNQCLEMSFYDDDLFYDIAGFIKEKTKIEIDADLSFDEDDYDEDDFIHYIKELKERLHVNHFIMLLFSSDQYYENQFFILVLANDLFLTEPTIDSNLFYAVQRMNTRQQRKAGILHGNQF